MVYSARRILVWNCVICYCVTVLSMTNRWCYWEKHWHSCDQDRLQDLPAVSFLTNIYWSMKHGHDCRERLFQIMTNSTMTIMAVWSMRVSGWNLMLSSIYWPAPSCSNMILVPLRGHHWWWMASKSPSPLTYSHNLDTTLVCSNHRWLVF